MLAKWISWILTNLGLVLLFVAILIAQIDWITYKKRGRPPKAAVYDIYYRWLTLLPLGITSIYSFIMHAFFPDMTAASIGWQNSPFQFEVAMANLGFGLVAIFAFNASYGFRLANIVGSTCWLWGDAVGHIYQIVINHNYTTGNAGSWFLLDVVVPTMLLICIIQLRPKNN